MVAGNASLNPHATDRDALSDGASVFRWWTAAGLGIALVVAGGASRADEPQQMLVRLAAIAAILLSLWPLQFDRLHRHRGWLVGIAATYALVAAQLVPLPADWWARLPGHGLYARIAEQSGSVGWRPLSLTPDLTVNALFGLLPATAAGLAALFLGSSSRARLARWAVIAACASGLLGLVQLAAGGNSLHLFRQSSDASAVGVFANRNHQAAFLACALPLLGAWAGTRLRRDSSRHALLALAGMAGLLLVAIIATGSRMGLLLAGLGALAAFASLRVGGPAPGTYSWRQAGLGAAVFAVLAATIALVAGRVGLVERLGHAELAASARVNLFGPYVTTAEAFMPWGAGFGSFDSVFRRFEPDANLSTIYMNHAHNEPFQLAIEGGVPALLLLGLFLWWWGRTAYAIARAGRGAMSRPFGLAAVAVTAMLMMSSLVDYPLRTPLLGALFALACVEMMRSGAALDAAGH